MSAESQAQHHRTSSQQPSAALQLWQEFLGGNLANAAEGTSADLSIVPPTGATFLGISAAAAASQQPYNSSNNNYVNFNQFIMQHNFLGGANSSGGSGFNAATAANNDIGAIGDSLFSGSGNANNLANGLDNYQQTSNLFSNTNTNSNLFPYNNDSDANSFYINGVNCSNNDYSNSLTAAAAGQTNQHHFYDNLYTPFGSGGDGTTYYANPFATGFDFSAVTSSSNLHATAPEFVPRFTNLSLNESAGVHHDDSESGVAALEQLKNNFNNSNNTAATDTVAAVQQTNDELKSFQNTSEESKSSNAEVNNYEPDSIKSKTSSASLRSAQPNTSTGAIARPSGVAFPANKQQASSQNNNQRSDSRASFSNGFTNVSNAVTVVEKPAAREREQRQRFSNVRRSMDYREDREERYERAAERTGGGGERGSGHGHRGGNHRERYDNHRSNKRRDDWNRNRDRINGYRVEEKYSSDNGKDSPLPSPEKKSPKKIYPENEKLSQREKLMRDIETRRLECLVCVEPIKAHHSVWSCHNCYHILHLQCIIKWASSSKSDDGWRCPACQNVVKDVPRDYYCFCGKLKNPQYTRQDVAHSCGEVCGRVEGCAHACTLLCHPGPCPPCQAHVKRECGCGKTTKVMQCCLKEPNIECDAICSKLLNCELHTCADKCHVGKCPPCGEKVEQQCHCSKQERQVLCTRDSHDKHTYSCGKTCARDLTCGNHKCKDCCHAGDCRPCKLSPEMVTSCPCGKMPLMQGQRTSCLDAIPVCEGVCSKTLRCGKAAHPHHCTSKCHLGNCPPCNKQTAVKCRCGHMDQLIKCRQLSTRADDARCKKRCVKKRSCGKHKCNQECCIDIDHICPMPCNYTLSCGKHKCDQPCHRGNCPPCYRSSFEELYCECGAEVIYPPVPCGTKRPICKRPCSRSHPCEHAPQHNCHSAASCPPCMMFTTKWCFGQHEQRKTIPCSQESFSCGLACQKPLPCGRHKCIRACHEGVCQLVQAEVCKQSCTALRAACGHKCMAPCHTGECPETPCKEMVEVQCDCGNRKQQRSCHDLAREYSRIATAQLASSMAEMQRGNYMELSEILAPVKTNKTNKTLDCNEECRLLDRNRRLAIGLQIRNPDLPQKLLTKYSDFIRNFAKRDSTLVRTIFDSLTNLVKLAKESKQKSRSHSFPIMNREKRQLVHEMCEMFGVDSVAYDAEPNRNVVATAHKDRSWLPATSIMEVMQRESGQRRVPVPSNNAWGIKR